MKKVFFMLVFLGILIATVSFAEELTVTTYYPAPFGVYEELRAGEFYGYDDTYYNLVEVPGVSTATNRIYYGVDPEEISEGTEKDGSFLRQLYVGSELGPSSSQGSGGWTFDGRTALYVHQPPTGQEFTAGIYSGTVGQKAYAINGQIIYEDSNPYPSPGSVAVLGGNNAEATGTGSAQRTIGVQGVTGSGADGGIGVQGLSLTDNGIAIYAEAFDADSRAIIVPKGKGRVGIGTDNPQSDLHVKREGGPGVTQIRLDYDYTTGITNGDRDSFWVIEAASNYGFLYIKNPTTSRLAISNAGYLGIGADPGGNNKLDIALGATESVRIRNRVGTTTAGPLIYAENGNLIIQLGDN